MKSKTFVHIIGTVLGGYLFFNLVVWTQFTRDVLSNPECKGGDLSRLGYIRSPMVCKQTENNLPRQHLEEHEYKGQTIGVLTIGDSFSSGGGGGLNSYYQDHLASISDVNVLNLLRYKRLDSISTISMLNNNGYLDRIKPEYVLIECSEKFCLNDLPDTIDFSRGESEKEMEQYGKANYHSKNSDQKSLAAGGTVPFKMDFISDANFKLVRNNFLYHFSDHAFYSQVYKAKLVKPLFSDENSDTLLFLDKDIKDRQNITVKRITLMNDYLNSLADRLAVKGIKLIFMPAVDKYDLYSNYVINRKYPESQFFDEFRKLPKRYRFIDTKALLREELEKGEKDVFHADDTHWSWKASRKIFETVRFN
jgi:hypothetical protein